MNKIRKKFIAFFCRNDHKNLSSASVVPHSDPTLLFTSAGMVPFKDYFLQNVTPEYKNLVTSQKCVRAGGKHNDLENVGYTKRHHTFFEMLGNFSFGGYFKEKAIELAWRFLTEELKLSQEKLYITVFKDDDEAFNIWHQLTGFDDKKIIRISTDDNFWQMGDTGPCGPCSEIFYDHGSHLSGNLPGDNIDTGERYVEIWNLVFMQYSRNKFGVLEKLPTPCIDTGMGLERISAVIECTDDNFCIDIFRALIEKSQKITDDTEHKTAHRVIADHLRSASFLIADGVMPSNTGRGYVLRRIIRRAVRYVGMLGYEKPIFSQIFPVLEKYMAETYPELGHNKELIISTLNSEEESFHLTLKNGLAILEENIKNLKPGDTLPGEVAFTLYDTYGFPLDLTIDALKEKNIAVDEAGFLEKMAQQKAKARGAWVGSGVECIPEVLTKVFKESGKTEFVGYDADNLGAKIIAILDEDGNLHQSVTGSNKKLQIILDRTPFYAESGGQEGDHGTLTNENITLSVYDTKKTPNGIISHYCATLGDKRVSLGDSFIAQINSQRRAGLMRSHSATHLLHHALRNLLGTHVTQKGSLVADDRLRFDFSYMQSLTEEQISEIEKQVNIVIWSNLPVSTTIKSVDDAIKSGAVALFGEKYDKDVRVVCMGDSVELCGGTHVANTSSIGIFKIISEGSIARGVRRIEAIVHTAALLYIKQQESKFAEEVKNFEARLKAENKIKQQELFELYKIVAQNIKEKREVLSNNIQIIVKELPKVPQDVAKRLITENLEERSIRIFIIINQSKVFVSIAASSDILSILDMENIINICKKEAKTTIGSLRGNFAQVIFNDKNLIENCYQAIRTRLVEIK